LQQDLGIEAKLIHAEKTGTFDVLMDGQLIFSKFETGRFPDPGEVSQIIRDRGLNQG